jgi:hypothetical protein
MKLIIFTDFDGVLHPFFPEADVPDEENQYFSYAPNLEKVVKDLSQEFDVEVVIASSWRNTRTIEQLREFLPEGLRSYVIGKNPHHAEKYKTDLYNREDECRQYLKDNNLDCLWVVLDDEPDWYYTKKHLVICPNRFKENEMEKLKQRVQELKGM